MSVQTGSARRPNGDPPSTRESTSQFRARRRVSIAEARRRRETLTRQAPSLDPQLVNVLACTDSLWGPNEQWRAALAAYVPAGLETGPDETTHEKVAPPRETTANSSPVQTQSHQRPALHWLRRFGLRRRQPELTPSKSQDPPFDVPAPGRRLPKVGRNRSWVTRLALIVGPLLLAGGLAYSCGVSTGSSRLVQQGSISASDAATFHLTSFPADRVAGFGAAYLSLCWTHPAPADPIATQDRRAALARMTSAGVTAGCGWIGTTPAAPPLTVQWDGTVTPYQGAYADGLAARLGFVITTTDQQMVGVTLPVWVPSATSGAGARVIGDVAVVPVATVGPAPTPAAPAVTDSAVAEALTNSVLVPFLRAWAASDPVQLNLVLARDASAAARTGMGGKVSSPTVSAVRVAVVRGDPTAYRDGDLVTAQLTVDWTTTGGVQRSGYSIGLRLTAGRWQITDIGGAAPDPAGGAAPATTFAAPTSSPAPPAG